ncbi:MAG: SCO family protein [Planctomycetes bacterium]|nr:SCO family protein [Planctomycetota bacterium]
MKRGRLGFGLLLLALGGCSEATTEAAPLDARTESADRFGTLAPFTLVDSSGRTITNADLAGRVCIASFVFTTCSGPCPTISANFRAIQDDLPAEGVRLLSISVDPATDTPEVMGRYAEKLGADRSRWMFLTGKAEEIDALIRSSFALPVDRSAPGAAPVGQQVTHSTKVVVIDGRGVIAGYYSGTELPTVREALARAKWLSTHGG